jgi:hypothetical protein
VFFDFGAEQANLGKDAFAIEAEGLFGLAEFGAEGFLEVGDSAVSVDQGGEGENYGQDRGADLRVGRGGGSSSVSGSHIPTWALWPRRGQVRTLGLRAGACARVDARG